MQAGFTIFLLYFEHVFYKAMPTKLYADLFVLFCIYDKNFENLIS